jgi:NADP-dependent 3-hydroxy acid dehydrogenase YdfG
MDLELTGKVVSSPAPVAASAKRLLAREGCGVVVVARSGELLQELAAAAGTTATVAACRASPITAAKQAFFRPDILVNNAGTIKRGDVFALSRRR